MKKKDFYFNILESSWPKIVYRTFLLYLIVNLIFAIIYTLIPNSLGEETSFANAFFFSVQTISTIGYGSLIPQGILTNIIVTIQSALGIAGVAMATGLLVAKLAKPHAKIRFSKNMIVSLFNNQKCLSFRIGNIRGNDILEAKVRVSILLDETTAEGSNIKRVHDLKLQRSQTSFFKFTWSIFHSIDEKSPLYHFEKIKDSLISILVTVTGHDGTYSSTVYSRKVYYLDSVIKDKYFADIMTEKGNGEFSINFDQFDSFSD